ncbi:NTP pyrophosphohydrolase [Bacillus spizizenii]|nr:NTP pyrophosphohydrolase [Bacillus spizizenii]OWV38944.1 NTP pyrophosphohydrolase [Bacillus spizizenii]
MIIHHIKVSFDVLLTKASEIQYPENDYKVGDKLFIRESNGDRTFIFVFNMSFLDLAHSLNKCIRYYHKNL